MTRRSSINTRRLRTHNIVEARHAAWDGHTVPDGAYNLRIETAPPLLGAGSEDNWERVTPAPRLEVLRSLRLRSGGCSLLKNWGRLVEFRDAEEDQRRIRSGLQTAVCVVDIDVGFSEA
jgi:hypothetical protein